MNNEDKWLISAMMKATLERDAPAENPKLRQTLLSFLEVLDSLDRLVKVACSALERPESESSNWLSQLQILRKQLLNVFERSGVTFIDCVGQPFDPTKHEAVEVVHRNDVEDNIIMEEVSPGCNWQGEVLRFARVVVARSE